VKTTNTAGIYVIHGMHYIDLQDGQELAYPDSYTNEKFTGKSDARKKYPNIKTGDES